MPAASHPALPIAGKVTVGPDERKLFKARREALGLRQKDLAKRVGCSGGTISNMENGKHPQIEWETYVALRRVLLRDRDAQDSGKDVFLREVIPDLLDLDAHDEGVVKAVLASLKKPR